MHISYIITSLEVSLCLIRPGVDGWIEGTHRGYITLWHATAAQQLHEGKPWKGRHPSGGQSTISFHCIISVSFCCLLLCCSAGFAQQALRERTPRWAHRVCWPSGWRSCGRLKPMAYWHSQNQTSGYVPTVPCSNFISTRHMPRVRAFNVQRLCQTVFNPRADIWYAGGLYIIWSRVIYMPCHTRKKAL